MRVHVVSDVHGNAEALARAGEGADALVVLGDLLDFVDYHEHDRGILGTLFGPEKVGTFARLRREGTRDETVAFSRSLWNSLDDPGGAVEEAIRAQYAELFAAMTAPTYATPGNVDSPHLWPEFAGDGLTIVDGEVIELGGLRFGFVGGVVLPPGATVRRTNPVWRPYLRERDEFDAAVDKLDDVQVLCTHVPLGVSRAHLRRRRPPPGAGVHRAASADRRAAAALVAVRARAPAAVAAAAGGPDRMP